MDKSFGVESKDLSYGGPGLSNSFDNEESKELSIRYPILSEYNQSKTSKLYTKKKFNLL